MLKLSWMLKLSEISCNIKFFLFTEVSNNYSQFDIIIKYSQKFTAILKKVSQYWIKMLFVTAYDRWLNLVIKMVENKKTWCVRVLNSKIRENCTFFPDFKVLEMTALIYTHVTCAISWAETINSNDFILWLQI